MLSFFFFFNNQSKATWGFFFFLYRFPINLADYPCGAGMGNDGAEG